MTPFCFFFLSFYYKIPCGENRFYYRLKGQHILCLLELDLLTSIYNKYIPQFLNILYKWLIDNKNKLRPEKFHPVLRHIYNVKNNWKNTEFFIRKVLKFSLDVCISLYFTKINPSVIFMFHIKKLRRLRIFTYIL